MDVNMEKPSRIFCNNATDRLQQWLTLVSPCASSPLMEFLGFIRPFVTFLPGRSISLNPPSAIPLPRQIPRPNINPPHPRRPGRNNPHLPIFIHHTFLGL